MELWRNYRDQQFAKWDDFLKLPSQWMSREKTAQTCIDNFQYFKTNKPTIKFVLNIILLDLKEANLSRLQSNLQRDRNLVLQDFINSENNH